MAFNSPMLLALGLILSFVFFPTSLHLLDFMANVSAPLHQFCQEQWGPAKHFTTDTALFCGSGIEEEGRREPLVGAGLYHLVLFSGFHMGLLERFLRKWCTRRSLVPSLVLGFFALLSGWAGRVVRTFVRSLLRERKSTPRTLLLRSWLFCLALHPQWIHSLSLHLSAAAGLAFLNRSTSFARASLKVFVLLAPLFAGWAPLHPWIPLAGILLAPFALILWVSEALVEFVHPRGLDFLNRLDDGFRELLEALDRLHPAWAHFSSGSSDWGWFYILMLFFGLHLHEVLRERKKQRAPR